MSTSLFEKQRSEVIKPFVKQFAPSGKRVIILDVGGYIGTVCIPIAKYLKAEGLSWPIHVFEPSQTYELLSINIDFNQLKKEISRHNSAAGDVTGYVFYNYRKDGLIGGQIYSKENTEISIPVPCTKIDDFVEEHYPSVASSSDTIFFIKIDTQGFEAQVMDGMSKLLKLNTSILEIEYLTWASKRPCCGGTLMQIFKDQFHIIDMPHPKRAKIIPTELFDDFNKKLDELGHFTDLLLVPRKMADGKEFMERITNEIWTPDQVAGKFLPR